MFAGNFVEGGFLFEFIHAGVGFHQIPDPNLGENGEIASDSFSENPEKLGFHCRHEPVVFDIPEFVRTVVNENDQSYRAADAERRRRQSNEGNK
jgi:hypothetical protein